MNLQHFKLTATNQMSITSDSINKILNFIKVEFKFFIIPISWNLRSSSIVKVKNLNETIELIEWVVKILNFHSRI
jgi:hypothetical protein